MRRTVALMFGLSLLVIVKVHCHESIGPVVNGMIGLREEVVQVKKDLVRVEVKVINQIDLAKISLGVELKQDMKQHVRDAMAEILQDESIEDMVRSQTVSDVRQLKRENKQMKTKLYHVMKSLGDVQKERDDYKEALAKAENQSSDLKCIVYTEATGTETEVSNSFINSQLQLMQSVSNLALELQSIKTEQDTARQDLLSTRSEMKMFQTSVNVTRADVLSLKSDLTQVQARVNVTRDDVLSIKSDLTQVQASVNVTDKDVLMLESGLTQVQVLLNDSTQTMEERIVQLENATKSVRVSYRVGCRHHGDSCFRFSTVQKDFASARTICEDMGSRLAIITSESENDFIKSYASQIGHVFWLGGSDVDSEGEWKWEGGSLMNYTDWALWEPNDIRGQEDCLTLNPKTEYHWNDAPCQDKYNFICEAFHF